MDRRIIRLGKRKSQKCFKNHCKIETYELFAAYEHQNNEPRRAIRLKKRVGKNDQPESKPFDAGKVLVQVLVVLLTVGICLVALGPVTNLIDGFVASELARNLGLMYNADQVLLLKDKILDLVLEIAHSIIEAITLVAVFKMRG